MNTAQIQQLHREAMMVADDADILKRQGKGVEAQQLYKKAYYMEHDAAIASINAGVEELSVSILVKSAAFLAYDAGLIRESEQMVGLALSRNLPEELAEEMRDLLENINFSRHLRLNGVVLSDNEVQIVVAGKGVGYGMAREDDVNDRISTFKQLAVRTAERVRGKDFRKKGQPAKEIKEICTSYLSVSRAASFAVTMRIGETSEKTLEAFQGGANALIDDIATNLILANDGNVDVLKERIKDQAYLENFVSLAKEFAPDGDRVNLVGLTFNKAGKKVPVELTTPKERYREVVASLAMGEPMRGGEEEDIIVRETLIGIMFAANSSSDQVKLQVEDKKYPINVPEGLAEIVRKYFDMEVIALVSHDRAKNTYKLVSIDPKEEEPQLF